jgi:hypothetical protein
VDLENKPQYLPPFLTLQLLTKIRIIKSALQDERDDQILWRRTTLSEIRRHAAGQHREFAKQIVSLEPAFGQSMQARIIRPLVARILAQQLKPLIRQAIPHVDCKRLVDVLHDDAPVSACGTAPAVEMNDNRRREVPAAFLPGLKVFN